MGWWDSSIWLKSDLLMLFSPSICMQLDLVSCTFSPLRKWFYLVLLVPTFHRAADAVGCSAHMDTAWSFGEFPFEKPICSVLATGNTSLMDSADTLWHLRNSSASVSQ